MSAAALERFVCVDCGAGAPAAGACPRDGGAMVDRRHDALLGSSLGPYRLAKLIGAGGMGRVYRAVQPQIGSRVAIKVLSREAAADTLGVERFFAEARAVNIIRHEHIVNVLDLGRMPDGRPYSVMEFLDGATLTQHITPPARPPLADVGRWFAQVLAAIGAAHHKQVLHRDLKPDNVFITPSGQVKLLDFGIAKLRPEQGGALSQSLHILGTPAYMAPEQATGHGVLDGRADLYAIGVMLFEALAGQRPFDAAADFELLRMHLEEPPPSLGALRPDLPPGVEQVVQVALAKDPAARFRTAEAMATALASALGTTRSSAPLPPVVHVPAPVTLATRADRPAKLAPPASGVAPVVRRARWPWVVAATVVLGGAGATAAVVLGRGSRSQAPPIAPAPPSPPGAAAPVHGELLTAAEGFAVVLPAGYVGQPTSSGLVAAGPDGDNLSCGQVRAGVPYTPDALVGWLIGSSTATLPAVTGTATRRSIGGVDRPVALFGDARARAEVVFYEAPGQTFYCAAGTTPARFDAQAPLRAEFFARRVVVPTVAPTAVRPGWPPTQQQAAMPGATVDVDAVIAATLAEQRRLAADLVVAYVMANDVEPDGVIRAERGQLALQLHSPAHAADAVCGVTTMAGRGTGVVRAPLTADCHVAPPPPPRCGMAALWRKARASGEIPATATTADIMWAADGAARREWFFMAGGEAVYLRDDC